MLHAKCRMHQSNFVVVPKTRVLWDHRIPLVSMPQECEKCYFFSLFKLCIYTSVDTHTHTHTAADLFGKSLKRQTALIQLAKGGRTVLRNSDYTSLILNEWRCIDFEATAKHAIYSQQISEASAELIKECMYRC